LSANSQIPELTPATPDPEDWEERAAIAEFDSGLSRTAAELLAGPPPPSGFTVAA